MPLFFTIFYDSRITPIPSSKEEILERKRKHFHSTYYNTLTHGQSGVEDPDFVLGQILKDGVRIEGQETIFSSTELVSYYLGERDMRLKRDIEVGDIVSVSIIIGGDYDDYDNVLEDPVIASYVLCPSGWEKFE